MRTVAFADLRRMELREAPDLGGPGSGEAVVAVAYCGVCGSDLHEYIAPPPAPRLAGFWQPVMGHELSGVVTAVGSDVQGVSVGDPVVVNPGSPCGSCFHCEMQQSNLCQNQLGGVGYTIPGGYAEYVRVGEGQLLPVRDPSQLQQAALSEPFGVALHALNRGGLQPGETLLVTGGGPIGLLTLLGARHKGAGRIIVSEPAQERRELAQRVGADVVIDPATGLASQAVRDLTDGRGADIAVECVGKPQPMADCFASVRRGGRIVVAGTFDREPYPVDLVSMLVNEVALVGTLGSPVELAQAVDLIVSGAVDVGPLISRVVGLDELPQTFEELTADRNVAAKVLVRPGAA